MPIQIVETRRLYRQISEQLRALIVAGEFPAGCRLPSERDLSVQLGVSRPSLREALIALEVEGYIEVRMGSGIYVSDAPPVSAPELDLSLEEGPLELIQARLALEGEVAAIAARMGRKAQFDAVEHAIDQMETDARSGINPLVADALFHARVAEATGNSVLVGVVRRLFDLRLGPLFDQLHSHFETAEVWAQAIAEHREVLKALRAKDPAAARAAMQQHMNIAYKRLSSSMIKSPKRRAISKAVGKPRSATRATAAAARPIQRAKIKTQ
jgi:DNA-binding FadR family transcriptional regulator